MAEINRAYGFNISLKDNDFKGLLKNYRKFLTLGCLLLLLTNLIVAFLPILINGGVSIIEKGGDFVLKSPAGTVQFPNIYWIIFAVVGLAILGALIRTLSRIVVFDVGRRIERDIRQQLFFHLSVQDDRFFRRTTVGDLMNHLTTDISNIRMLTGFAALNAMNIVFVFCFTAPLLLKIDVLLGLCALLPFPFVILSTRSISRRMFQETINYQEQLSRMVGHVQENLSGAHVIRLFHQQKAEGERFLKTNHETYLAGLRLARVRVLMMPTMRLMVGLAVGIVLYVGGQAVLSGRISLGDFVEVNARILQLAWPAMAVGFVMSLYSSGQASLKRINALLSSTPEIEDGGHHIDDVHMIRVHNLALGRGHQQHEGISFSLARGQMLGIVGPSGSYKTSLLKMLYRRNSVPRGKILLDGHDINDLTMSSLYEQVSVVSQEPFLFHASLLDNLCFMKPNATPEEVSEVLRITRLDFDMKSFSAGLDTIIGERGITLSGGQRARVALARALLAKRPILILDDALSAVDADTERHIVQATRSYLKESIVIIATHSLSAIRKATKIMVLDEGRVVESGTHEELLAEGSLYQSLWGIDQLKRRLS